LTFFISTRLNFDTRAFPRFNLSRPLAQNGYNRGDG
jgi:hypothetical protein